MCRFNGVTQSFWRIVAVPVTMYRLKFLSFYFLNVFFNLILTSARSTGLTEVKREKAGPAPILFLPFIRHSGHVR